MDGDESPRRVALRGRRAEVIEQLSQQFADDTLGLDEFERRVDLAQRARSLVELDTVVTDLAMRSPGLARRPPEARDRPTSAALVPAAGNTGLTTGGRTKRIRAILSESKREGNWRVPEKLAVLSVMGEVRIDFREAKLPAGVVELKATAVMGSVVIIVPPSLAVECNGTGVLGEFHELDRANTDMPTSSALLVIDGTAVMGSVKIYTRRPGESARDAKRRRRKLRKALRKSSRSHRRLGRLGARKPRDDDDD